MADTTSQYLRSSGAVIFLTHPAKQNILVPRYYLRAQNIRDTGDVGKRRVWDLKYNV
jgi:hypothetical protein